jgi:hypothetical protein
MKLLTCLMTTFILSTSASKKGFLGGSRKSTLVDPRARYEELRIAMDEVMGCGGSNESARFPEIEQSIAPMWNSMPKNSRGRVDWKQLRYMAHRYFMQQSSIMFKGFEPNKEINASHVGGAQIMDQHAPTFADMLMMGKWADEGYSQHDAVAMIATMEQIMFDSESAFLEKAMNQLKLDPTKSIASEDMPRLMEAYTVQWMFSSDPESLAVVVRDPRVLPQALPLWPDIKNFAEGQFRTMEHRRASAQTASARTLMQKEYTFDDAHEAIGSIGKTFASYWETECQNIKTSLVQMDKSNTGRVKLSDFYGSNMDGEWRFGESEAYLRDLGALDDSSWRGPQVIIPNYMQAASNCIVSTPNYLVCCVNECEDIMGEIEKKFQAPVAPVEEVLQLVGGLTNFNDESPDLNGTLGAQLHRIAEVHGGKVPLHGRLFAQWLHYVFPRECPFPHKIGATVSQTPVERGDDVLASKDEVEQHASKRRDGADVALAEEQEVMSQWTEDEELIGDYSAQLRAPWEKSRWAASGGVLLILLVAFAALIKNTGSVAAVSLNGYDGKLDSKTHFV